MRGKPKKYETLGEVERITPACAGKTRYAHFKSFISEDHPRVCGENSAKAFNKKLHEGSPPRVRGKPIAPRPGQCPREDHPRVCGENRLR